MKSSKMFVMTAGVISVGMMAAAASADFGTLTYGSTEIPFTWPGSGLSDNSGFVYTNSTVNTKQLTIGLRTSAYYDIANGAPTNDGVNTYTVNAGTTLWAPPAGSEASYPSYSASAPRWGFNWSVSMDGVRTAEALTGLNWAMRIIGPGGTWGSTVLPGADLGTAPNASAYSLNSWQMGYNFLQVDSNTAYGVPGAWSGLAFNPNQLGTYSVEILVRQGSTFAGSTTMFVNVVPAPGALALLGIAGLAGGRRRRA